jgi:dUTP pyrophosphatase
MQIKVKKLRTDAKLPTHGHPGDAGMDFYSIDEICILPGARVKIFTGISIEIPQGYVGLVWDKSSISFLKGIKTMGGVIDAGYRGEMLFCVYNIGEKEVVIEKGQKIAQVIIQKFEDCDIVENSELSDSIRGDQGFGSTGHK